MSTQNTEQRFSVATLNVGCASRDEPTPWRLGLRLHRIVAELAAVRARQPCTVICLQEVRLCRDFPGTGMYTAMEVANFIAGALHMAYVILPETTSPKAAHLVTLYPQELMLLSSSAHWMHGLDDPADGPLTKPTLRTVFLHKEAECASTAGRVFSVYNCHAPFPAAQRLVYAQRLASFMHAPVACSNSTRPLICCIVAGDFNTIPSLEGADTYARLVAQDASDCPEECRRGTVDLTPFTAETRRGLVPVTAAIGSTFRGFPHDADPATGIPWGGSQLDHIFVTLASAPLAAVCTKLLDNAVSDHALVEVSLPLAIATKWPL